MLSSRWGVLDAASPVNWGSPLTRGMATWQHFGLLNHYAANSGYEHRGVMRRPTGTMQGTSSFGVTHLRGLGPGGGLPGVLQMDATSFGPALPGTAAGTMDAVFTNPTACTILCVYRKRDTTARNSYLFGVDPLPAGDDRELSAHVPFGDGTTYWSFGGWVAGSTRLTASWTPDTLWHHWAFVVGNGQGMRIYLDGNLLASNSATPTRAVGDGATFFIANGEFASSDSAQVSEFAGFNRGLTHGEVVAWMKQSRAGHPDTLNWRRPHPSLLWLAAAEGGTPPPFDPSAGFPFVSAEVPPRAEPVPIPY